MEPLTTLITIVGLTQKILELGWHQRRQRSALRREINQKLSEWAAQALLESKRLDAYVELDRIVSQMKGLISNILEDDKRYDHDDTFWASVKKDQDKLIDMATGRLTDFTLDSFGDDSRVRIDERRQTSIGNVNVSAGLFRAGDRKQYAEELNSARRALSRLQEYHGKIINDISSALREIGNAQPKLA